MIELNWLAVVVVAVINMIIGALWYSPVLFGKKWMALMGKTEANMSEGKKDVWKLYVISFIGSLVMAFVLALFIEYRVAETFIEGAILGFLAWLGFVVPTSMGAVIFEDRSKGTYYINIFMHLVTFIIMGGILAIW